MAEAAKDTIYIDVDDEITNIIEKVKDSPQNIVALVLPKRATVLQSIVNMKLLKRSSDTVKKKVVLITSETSVLPLAGAVGVYVAKNLQSKPEIPPGPEVSPGISEAVIDSDEIESGEDAPVDNQKTVGELAGVTAVSAAAASTAKKADKTPKKKGDSKFKIPNFEKFRTRLLLIAAGVIGLFIFLYWAFFVAPSAKITVVTDTATINKSLSFTPSVEATELDAEEGIVPAKNAESKDVQSEKVAASGTKDVGEKATGSVTMTATKCSGNPFIPPSDLAAGSGLTVNGKTYITANSVSFSGTGAEGGCFTYAGSNNVQITAQQQGSSYNVNNVTFSAAGRSDITAQGSASGGTDKTIKVVSQTDVDNVANKLTNKGDDEAKKALRTELEAAGYLVIEESFKKSKPEVSSSPTVGSEATEATVTVTTTYTMTGVKKDALENLLKESAKDDIDSNKQQVVNTGLDEATFTINGDKIAVSTIITAGPKLDVPATIEQIAGKKRSEVQNVIQANPGVKDVRIDYSPFWVTSTPKKTSKIQIVFEDNSNNE